MRATIQKKADAFQQLDGAVSRIVDCWLEAKNNIARREPQFAAKNLRKLFDNASAISKRRKNLSRQLRIASQENERR